MRVTILGQIAGPIGGQSRLTQAYRDGRTDKTDFLEFWGHKSALGPFMLVWQCLAALRIAFFGRCDAAYIATSRSTFGMFRDLILLLPFILARVPVISHVHGAEFDEFYLRNSRFARVKSFYLNAVSQFIFVNEVFVPTQAQLARKSAFVRNPIPQFAVEMLEQSDRPKRRDTSRRCFGFISTFAPEKGVEHFLEAADRFSDRADFVVAGGPSIQDEAFGKRILSRIEASPNVAYLGYLSDPSPFYESCDFMIFPTNFASETSSLVVIEALATRTHPIVRRHNRLTDIFGSGQVSWFDDPDALMQQVEAAIAMPAGTLEAWYDLGQSWITETFPTEVQWVASVEAIVRQAAHR